MPASRRSRRRGIAGLGGQRGHSLVEVMASIIILSIAIIPMVGMFDAGLGLATRSGNYDRARAFASERLEYARSMSYGEVRDGFPTPPSAPGAGGSYSSPDLPVPASARLPSGATYGVVKQYVTLSPSGAVRNFADTPADSGMMRLLITVEWGGSSYSASGVVVDGSG